MKKKSPKPKASSTVHVVAVVTNAEGQQGTIEGDLVWSTDHPTPPTPITIAPDTLPPMQVGTPVDLMLAASGGAGPYGFAIESGALPPGVTLAIDGRLTGTPTGAGVYAVDVVATDANQISGTQMYDGTVADAVAPVSGDVLTENDFEYLGALRLPNDSAGLFQFAYGGIAGRKVNGKTRLFMSIDEVNYHGSILEFEVPTAAPSKDAATSPQMTRVRWWGDVYGGRRGTYMTTALARSKYDELVDAANVERDPERAALIRQWAADLLKWIGAADMLKWIEGRKKSGDEMAWYEFPVGMSGLAALLWDDASKRLFWTYFDFYNVSGRPDWGLGASTLNDETIEGAADSFAADGPWRFAVPVGGTPGAGWTAYGPWRGGGLIVRPDTGELIVSGSIMSGNAGSPWGPCGYGGGRLPRPGAPWDADLVQPTCYLEHYYLGGKIDAEGRLYPGEDCRAFRRRVDPPHWENFGGGTVLNINPEIYGYGSWRQVDGSGLVLWADNINGKSGLIFAGQLCGTNIPGNPKPGHEWYSNPGNDFACPNHQIPSPLQITGPVSTGSFSTLISYALADMLKVAAGEIPDYSPEPTCCLNIQAKWSMKGAPVDVMGGNNSFGGSYFDRDDRLLYMLSPKADGSTIPGIWAPYIQVFRIGGPV